MVLNVSETEEKQQQNELAETLPLQKLFKLPSKIDTVSRNYVVCVFLKHCFHIDTLLKQ